ncbi:MAG: TolC family protein [Halanaerobium sp.]
MKEQNKVSLILFLLFFILAANAAAEDISIDLESYLKISLENSRELKEAELNLKAKAINLKEVEAEQEVNPSPSLLTQAKLELELAEKKLLRKEDELINNYINDFFNYFKTENSVEVHQRYLKVIKNEMENIEDKYEQGLLTKSDIYQAEVELKTVESNLVKARNDKERVGFKLKQNLNNEKNDQLDMKFSESDLKAWELNEDFEELLDISLKNRIDIKEAEVNKELKKINFKLAARDYSPKLKKIEAENEYLSALNNTKVAKDMVELDLNNAYLNFKDSLENINKDRKLIESYNEALIVKKLYFEEDYITGVELLAAQVDLYQAEVSFSHSKIDYYLSLTELYLSTGDFKELLIYAE